VPTDAELVERVHAGDADSFAELFRRHQPAVRMAVADHVSNLEDRRDIVQEAFIRAYRRLDSLNDPDRFRPWVLQIARNAAVDHVRRAVKRRADSIDHPDAEPIASDDPGPVDLVELSDLAARVNSGFARLSPRDATALAMSVHFGFGPAELASALGITENNAKVVLHRARRRLRAVLDAEAE
jgi:RNA polymerase sigma-70 factor (ECF subfamily)